MTDEQASDWAYKMICCLGISTSNSDINVVGLHKTVKELYEQGRTDEREAQVCCGDYEKCWKACTPRGRWLAEKELAKPEQDWSLLEATQESLREHQARIKELEAQPEPRQLQRLRQEAWKSVRDVYRDDPEVCFAMGFDVGFGAVARKVEPSQEECGEFDSRPAPLKRQWVELTENEIKHSIRNLLEDDPNPLLTLADVIQEKLKEKNERVF